MRRWRSVGLVLAFALVPIAALAQETTGTLSGTIVDPQDKPVAFATVSVSGPTGDRTALTDEDGRFLMGFLTPGEYTVHLSADGFSPLTDEAIRIGLGQRSLRRYVLMPVMQETVQVVGEKMTEAQQIFDTTTQTSGANIPTDLAEKIPLSRNVQSVAFLVPGVKDGGGTGPSNPSIGGSSGLENMYVFDGINVTNAGFGSLGSYSILEQYQSLGQGINFNFVAETQVLTGGFAPEFGQASGGIVNVVTKSGGNEWAGSLYGNYTPTAFQSRFKVAQTSPPFAPFVDIERFDYGFDVGGPLKKDHLFFWIGANPTLTRTQRQAPDSSFPLHAGGPYMRELEGLNYAAKLTLQVNPDHRIDVSAFGDPSRTGLTFNRESDALRAPDFTRFSKLEFGNRNWTVRYQGTVRPDFLLSASVAKAHNELIETFSPEGDLHRVTNLIPLQEGTGDLTVDGGLGFFENNKSDNLQFSVKGTHFKGTHEIKWGVGVEDIDYTGISDRTGPSFVTHDGRRSTTGASVLKQVDDSLIGDPNVREFSQGIPVTYTVIRASLSDIDKDTHSDYRSLFLQDTWSITPHLHFSFGTRWEQQSIEGELLTYKFRGEFSPRLGISWDPSHRGAMKVYGHWGRFFEKIPLDMAVRLFSEEINVDQGEYYDAGLTMPIPDGTGGLPRYDTSGSTPTEIVKGTRNSYTDALLLGYQRDVGAHWNLRAEYTQREIKRVLEDFADTPGSAIALGDAGFGHYQIGNIPPDVALGPGLEWVKPRRKYQALVLEATRRGDERWYVTLQYTRSRLRGNYEGLFRNDNRQADPNLTSLFDFPNEPLFYESFTPGPLNTDRPHRFQTFGYYGWANGWSVGSRFFVQSGIPRLRLASHPVYENTGEISLVRRGSIGRTPTEWNLDFSFGKKWKLPTAFDSTFGFDVEIFNVTNKQYETSWDFDADQAVNLDQCTLGDPDCLTEERRLERLVASVANGVPNLSYGKAKTYSNPREVRLGVRWTF